MADTSRVPSAIGIDAVECVPEPTSGATVRVTGRWGRRRPEWQGPSELVIEAGGQRHRVAATQELPPPTDAPPDVWRMTFAVPAELAEHLHGPVWLSLGAVMVPLALPRPDEMGGGRVPPDVELLARSELPGYVAAAQSAWRRARDAQARAAALQTEVQRLEGELEQARHEPERLQALIAERDRAIVAASQALHAETARREELEDRLEQEHREADRLRRRARGLAGRVEELKRELRRVRRGVDEARHEAAAARAAAARAAPRRAQAFGRRAALLVLEIELSRTAYRAVPAVGPSPPAPCAALGLERSLVARFEAAAWGESRLRATNAALRAELGAARRALIREREGHSGARERIAELDRDLASQREHTTRALTEVADARRALARRREAPPGGAAAEGSVSGLAPPPDLSILERLPEAGGAAFEADRLKAALDRLRAQYPEGEEPAPPPGAPPPDAPGHDTAPPPDPPGHDTAPPPDPPGHDTPPPTDAPDLDTAAPPDALPRLFRALVRTDPAAAGRLVLGLLPAQRLAYPRPVAYDLVLGAGTCLRVTVGTGAPEIELARAPRALDETQFRVQGDPAGLARLLAAGPVRRRLWRGLARRQGERAGFKALQQLTATAFWPRQLDAVGVTLDAALTLRLAALMIEGAAVNEAFSLAHRADAASPPDATLHVAPGGRATVSELGLELPATTEIVCAGGAVLSVLLGRRGPGVTVRGDERPLQLVRRALERA